MAGACMQPGATLVYHEANADTTLSRFSCSYLATCLYSNTRACGSCRTPSTVRYGVHCAVQNCCRSAVHGGPAHNVVYLLSVPRPATVLLSCKTHWGIILACCRAPTPGKAAACREGAGCQL